MSFAPRRRVPAPSAVDWAGGLVDPIRIRCLIHNPANGPPNLSGFIDPVCIPAVMYVRYRQPQSAIERSYASAHALYQDSIDYKRRSTSPPDGSVQAQLSVPELAPPVVPVPQDDDFDDVARRASNYVTRLLEGVFKHDTHDLDPQRSKPPTGSLPIDRTTWSGDHNTIKKGIGARPDTDVRIDPDGNVWSQNPDGSWSDHGPADSYTGSGRPSGRTGRDRRNER